MVADFFGDLMVANESMHTTTTINPPAGKVSVALADFTKWLENYGEVSWDHQSFFAGPVGGRAKGLYYKNKLLGTAAVAPMIFCEAFFPPPRRLFHHPMRLPIADAHYAMGFAFLYEATGKLEYLEKAIHFLEVLKETRSPGFKEYCWGYPFDWVTRNGVIKAHTPLITTTPYVFETFLQVFELVERAGTQPNDRSSVLRPPPSVLCPLEQREEWRQILESIVRHATTDIKDFKYSETASTCSYTPDDNGGVVNASAYRATMLASAAKFFGDDKLLKIANGNVNFVLAAQNADGSWPYAKDGVRNFVDHFHTCFVMKALAKVYLQLRSSRGNEAQTEIGNSSEPPHVGCYESENGSREQRIFAALAKGVDYYLKNLFGDDGMPRPFSKAPRLTVYKCELYDCAECINLCLLLRKYFPALENTLETVVAGILANWVKRDGSFRSRKLIFGWDNVPMHRWAQSQMFRSLAFYVRDQRAEDGGRRADDGRLETTVGNAGITT